MSSGTLVVSKGSTIYHLRHHLACVYEKYRTWARQIQQSAVESKSANTQTCSRLEQRLVNKTCMCATSHAQIHIADHRMLYTA